MISARRFCVVLLACYFVLPCFAQKPRVVIANAPSKEIKRAAHRLRIPVEQLKNAREALEEATDLIKKIKPCPFEQFSNLAQMWEQVNHSKAKEMLESFVRDLRSEAAACPDFQCYQQATLAGTMLMQTSDNYERLIREMRSWPAPDPSWGDSAASFRDSMEAQAKNLAMYRLANSDPEKALQLLSDAGDSGTYNYTASAQIAQSLMNTGKKEEALNLIDQSISRFDQNSADPRALQEYENFVRMTAMGLDQARANKAFSRLLTALTSQKGSGPCSSPMLRSGDTSVELSCAEARILGLLRNSPMKPAFTLQTLDSLPTLKSKLDQVGGIDSLWSGMYGGSGANIVYGAAEMLRPAAPNTYGNIPAMVQSLKGKTESDPALVRGKLKDLDIDALANLAMSAFYQDPDLSAIAIEMAQKILPGVEPLSKKAATLQNLVRAARQVDGEVPPELLKTGFAVADQLREQSTTPDTIQVGAISRFAFSQADQLEAFLVSELSRDVFDSAISYVRSMENTSFKLTCLIQIVQAQCQPNY